MTKKQYSQLSNHNRGFERQRQVKRMNATIHLNKITDGFFIPTHHFVNFSYSSKIIKFHFTLLQDCRTLRSISML